MTAWGAFAREGSPQLTRWNALAALRLRCALIYAARRG